MKDSLCSTLNTHADTDGAYCLYCALILSIFVHVLWKLADTEGSVADMFKQDKEIFKMVGLFQERLGDLVRQFKHLRDVPSPLKRCRRFFLRRRHLCRCQKSLTLTRPLEDARLDIHADVNGACGRMFAVMDTSFEMDGFIYVGNGSINKS